MLLTSFSASLKRFVEIKKKEVTKEEIYTYAKQEKIRFFEDPTNRNDEQMRAQLRKNIIPKLEKIFPGLKRSVARYAASARKIE